MNNVYIVKRYDVRPIDFHTGKKLAVSDDEKAICSCCGKKIMKVAQTNTGALLGSECVNLIDLAQRWGLDKYASMYRVTKKQSEWYKANIN